MGSYDFSAQYQQAPVPAGGNMIKWEWFGFFSEPPPLPEGAIIVQSWDTASSTSELASYSVGITAQIDKNGTIHVLDVVRGRWEFPDLLREIIEKPSVPPAESDPHRGPSLGHRLAAELEACGLPVRPIKPKGDKVMRMRVHTAALEAGKVLLAKKMPPGWMSFAQKSLAFPYGKHDDQVDALSQLMTWAEDWRIPKCSVRHLRWAS